MIKLKVIILPIKFEQRKNKKKTPNTFFEIVTTIPVLSNNNPPTTTCHPHPKAESLMKALEKSPPQALSLGSPLSISEQLLIVSEAHFYLRACVLAGLWKKPCGVKRFSGDCQPWRSWGGRCALGGETEETMRRIIYSAYDSGVVKTGNTSED